MWGIAKQEARMKGEMSEGELQRGTGCVVG